MVVSTDLLDDLCGPVSGSVVMDMDVKVGVGLRQEGPQGLRNELLRVVSRNADGDERYLLGWSAGLLGYSGRVWCGHTLAA
jgi:hypothetical protein